MSDDEKKEEMERVAKNEGIPIDKMLEFEKKFEPLNAVWRGALTSNFKKWLEDEENTRIYTRDKERIALYVSEEDKDKWDEFIKQKAALDPPVNFTMSKLIRRSVDFYIDFNKLSKMSQVDVEVSITPIQILSKLSHDLKEPLTAIKGNAQLLIENYKDIPENRVLIKLNEIFDKSTELEQKIKDILEESKIEKSECDILIIDDDPSTITLLMDYFEIKGHKSKGIKSGVSILEELKNSNPKLVLLDIILPEIDGYEICKTIKSYAPTSKIPVFYITAVPGFEVEKKLGETKADGYFSKPFSFSEFEKLNRYLIVPS